MYCVTGDKSYLLTDYHSSRKYFVVKFTDGNGKQWFQLGYRWGPWTFWLQSVRRTEYGNVGCPLRFASCEAANDHIKEEREWLARNENSLKVTSEVVLNEAAASRHRPYEKSDEKRVFYDTKSLRNGALSGCETVPDPDSRVRETPSTPQPHATPPQGSVRGEGSVLRSRTENEPVAYQAVDEYGRPFGYAQIILPFGKWPKSQRVALYRQPLPAITDEEVEAVEWCIFQQAVPQKTAVTMRRMLKRLGCER